MGPPPSRALLRTGVPAQRIAGRTLHRIFLRRRASPWWFSSVGEGDDPAGRNRFDLRAPEGACYLGTTAIAAVLEAFQAFGAGLLPGIELRRRARGEVVVPPDTPAAAWLTAGRARGVGITAALWAGQDRRLTQRWAAELRGAGWTALYHGIQHDPSGRLRAVTLFDAAGEHPPYGDAAGWAHATHRLDGNGDIEAALARFGIAVTRSDPDLPTVSLEDSGLL